jgi:glycoprotein 6-alpha-L-fucosyltransferase
MDQVAHYYDIQEIRQNNGDEIQKRCVFLATDEPEVINEAFEKYSKNYKFYVDNGAVEKASLVESRYGYDSTESAILDVFRLATCEFLVCTFSSNLCRLAYELMQTQFGDDASWRFSSLDDLYYFDGIRTSSFVVRLRKRINFKI